MSEYMVCCKCSGQGKGTCHACIGSGKVAGNICYACNGYYKIKCNECNGTGNGPCAPGHSNVTLAKIGLFLLLSTIIIVGMIFLVGRGDDFIVFVERFVDLFPKFVTQVIEEGF